MRDRLLAMNEIEERKEWFVGVCRCIVVWGERWGAANTTELKVGRSETYQ